MPVVLDGQSAAAAISVDGQMNQRRGQILGILSRVAASSLPVLFLMMRLKIFTFRDDFRIVAPGAPCILAYRRRPIITSVDLMIATASSPFFSFNSCTASRVITAVSTWSPMRNRTCDSSPSLRTSSTRPRS